MAKLWIAHAPWMLTLACLAVPGLAEVRNVSTPETAKAALLACKPGDEVVFAPGQYANCELEIAAKGTDDKPIMVRAADSRATVFTGNTRINVSGRYITLSGLTFEKVQIQGALIMLAGAKNCRVTECRFLNNRGRPEADEVGPQASDGKAHPFTGSANDQCVSVSERALDNRIDNCTFINNGARAVQIRVRPDSQQRPARTRIDHNLVQDVPWCLIGNGREVIQVASGGTNPYPSQTVVDHNIFLRCNGESEVLSNKCSYNVYAYNLFKDCQGALSIRGGNHCTVEGNRIEDSVGLRLCGSDHRVVGNVLVGTMNAPPTTQPHGSAVLKSKTSLALSYGMSKEPGHHYQALGNCLIANNTIVGPVERNVTVGLGKGEDWGKSGIRNVPPFSNRIINNLLANTADDLLKIDDAPENVVDHNFFFASNQATVSDYGTNALKGDPQFVDPAAGDYRLSATSPALKAGLPLGEGGQGTPNIGAPAQLEPYGPIDHVSVGPDKYDVRWLLPAPSDANWQRTWAVEGNSQVTAADGKLCVRRVQDQSDCTLWYRQALPQNLMVRLKVRPVAPVENNAANINLFLHATEADGSPLRYGRSGKYSEYHQIPNYIVTLTGGFQPGWCRVRRDPGFSLLAEDAKLRSEVGKEYELVLTCQDGRLRYYVNGQRIHDITDPHPLPAGRFGLRTWNSNIDWQQVEFGWLNPSDTNVPFPTVPEPVK